MFKAGDSVICVDDSDTGDALSVGKIYKFKEVRADWPDDCYLEGFKGSWKLSRFELLESAQQSVFEEGDSLRCTNAIGVEQYLNQGEIYECKGMRTSKFVDVDTGKQDTYGYALYMAFDPARFEKVHYNTDGEMVHADVDPPITCKTVMPNAKSVELPFVQEWFAGLKNELVSTNQDLVQTSSNKYSREIKPEVFVDVYDVLRAFDVTDPCLQHLAKKALCAGLRGHKDRLEDLMDIKKSIERAIEMHYEWNPK